MTHGDAISYLTHLLIKKNITKAIICPGSRNAPLSLAFVRNPAMQTFVMIDERSAAFYALGMSQQCHEPVVLICTSGSAALNFAPAISEAYYQQIPLLVITADRPEELLDQGDGQMINQRNLYGNFIRGFYHFPISDGLEATARYQERIIIEACNRCLTPSKGPVHINIPLREPLYDHTYRIDPLKVNNVQAIQPEQTLSSADIALLSSQWNQSSKVMILIGQYPPDSELQRVLSSVAEQKQACILCESTSNLFHPLFQQAIDRTLSPILNEEEECYTPELLITLGCNLISRHIKHLLKNHPPQHHWHISSQNDFPDTFGVLDYTIPMDAATVFDIINPHIYHKQHIEYVNQWLAMGKKGKRLHQSYLKTTPFSDLKVFETITQWLPSKYSIQLANSSAVRYYQLFDKRRIYPCFSNRGTAGIDGSISTACGAAMVSKSPTLVITGDLSFFYDSNALWNNYLPQNLHIILINNGGGGIFRYIQGPSEQEELEYLFESSHHFSAEHIAKAFNVEYYQAKNQQQLEIQLEVLANNQTRTSLLEIFTPRIENGKILKDYFNKLKSL